MFHANKNSVKSLVSVILFAAAGVMYCVSYNSGEISIEMPTSKDAAVISSTEETAETEPLYLDINRASVKELTALPGIGESKAKAIADYRNAVGGFEKIEDIMLVPGIKDKLFSKIKEYIFVGEEAVHVKEGIDSR